MSSNGSIEVGGLKIARPLYDLVHAEMAPGTGVDADAFWRAMGEIVRDLGPKNQELLEKRNTIQTKIDAWHREKKGKPFETEAYRKFLEEIDYLVPEKEDFIITTGNVDPEIATIAGPQLVVPVDNARYALNAANARWGSLYDALYGANLIPEANGDIRFQGLTPRYMLSPRSTSAPGCVIRLVYKDERGSWECSF